MGMASGAWEAIGADFEGRHPGYPKSRREGLVLLASVMLEVRSANLMSWQRPCRARLARLMTGISILSVS